MEGKYAARRLELCVRIPREQRILRAPQIPHANVPVGRRDELVVSTPAGLLPHPH